MVEPITSALYSKSHPSHGDPKILLGGVADGPCDCKTSGPQLLKYPHCTHLALPGALELNRLFSTFIAPDIIRG